MTTLLKVGFVFAGMIVFFTEAMIFASEGASWVFWLAIILMNFAMVAIGCWNLSAATANRVGWLFMIVTGAFVLLASVPRIEGVETLIKPAFAALFVAVGVIALLKERANDHGAPAH